MFLHVKFDAQKKFEGSVDALFRISVRYFPRSYPATLQMHCIAARQSLSKRIIQTISH